MKKIPSNQGIVNIALIIFGLILSAVLIGMFVSGSKSKQPVSKPVITPTPKPTLACGLTVKSPKPYQAISQGFNIEGTVNGCGWTAFEAQAGTILAVLSDGTILSNPNIIHIYGNWMKIPLDFQVFLNLNQIPAPGSLGSLIFTNDDPSGENPKTVSIPVNF